MQHLEQHILSNYLSGALPEQDLRSSERHLVECDSCRGQLAFLVRLLDENVSPEEMAIIESVESPVAERDRVVAPALSLYERFWRWAAPAWKPAAVSISIILIVAVSWTFFNRPVGGFERTFEARLSGQPYSEFIHTRTGSATDNPPASSDDELKRLNADPRELGRFYLQHGDFTKAIAQLEDAKQKESSSVEISNDLGVAYMENGGDGSLERALGQFERALQFDPRYAPALFNLALVYERLGHLREAEQQLKLYLQIDSDSDWAKEVKSKLQLWKQQP